MAYHADIAKVHVVDAVPLAEIAETPTAPSRISRVTPQPYVMLLAGLGTMSISRFHPASVPMICPAPRLSGAGGSFG